jgi:hypothetical protein
MRTGLPRALIVVLVACGFAFAAFAQTASPQAQAPPQERVSYLRDIVVEKGETSSAVTCVLCSITVRGTVKGEAVAVWGNIEIEGNVEGEAVAAGGRVVLHGAGSAEGEIVAVGGRVVRSGSGTVKGDVSEVPFFYLPGQRSLVFPGTLIFVGCNLLFSMLYLAAGRSRVEALAETMRKRMVASFVVGAISMTVMMAAFAWSADLDTYDDEAMATVVTVWLVLAAPGLAGVSLAMGRILRREAGVTMGILVGAIVSSVLTLLPLAGLLVFGIVWVFAMGATFVGRFGFARAKAIAAAVANNP